MKPQRYSKKSLKSSKTSKREKSKTIKKNARKKKHFKKNNNGKSKKRRSTMMKKKSLKKQQMKKIMKGGAIPFSELNPSTLMEHTFSGIKGGLSGTLADSAQNVPNNLESGASVFDQPYLDAISDGTLNVAGESSVTHFAES